MPSRLKRKTSQLEPERTKKGKNIGQTATSSRPVRGSSGPSSSLNLGRITRSQSNDALNGESPTKSTSGKKILKKGIARKIPPPKNSHPIKSQRRDQSNEDSSSGTIKGNGVRKYSLPSVEVKGHEPVKHDEAIEESDYDGPSYWLMKAEPESRIEKGKDVKFSIDDLKNAVEPEAWDGVRNPSARNNMRTMMKGDQAFFYHSNCKKPGIVGIMEIVREHSVDESAFDPEHPYYDEKSTRDNPKWCIVHVEYRRKFPEIISLKELQKYARPNGTLENMQTLRMSRLSVSKVSKKEWEFILSLSEADDGAAAAAHQPNMTGKEKISA